MNESSDEEPERPAEASAASPPASEGAGNRGSAECSPKLEVSKPSNAYEFGQVLNAICTKKDAEACAHLLAITAPKDLPVWLSNKLEGDMFLLLIQSLKSHLVAKDPSLVYEHLLHLSKAQRFKVGSHTPCLGGACALGSLTLVFIPPHRNTGLSPFPDDPDTN